MKSFDLWIKEELGWHGFALPRLLNRYSPLTASLIFGVIWGMWHLPAFFLSGLPQSNLGVPVFLVRATFLAILGTWIFVRTERSSLLCFVVRAHH